MKDVQENDITLFSDRQTQPELIIVGELSQFQKDSCPMLSSICGF